MQLLPTSCGIPYLPDNYTTPADASRFGHPLLRAATFVASFLVLQALWGVAHGTWVERFLVDTLTVKPAAVLINLFDPSVTAMATGMRILSPAGNLNIRNGCDGSEIFFLLAAAFLIVPLTWRDRVVGFSLGVVWVFVLNQTRIAVLFYAMRADRALFDLLHTTAAPLVLIAATAIFFYSWIYHSSVRAVATPA